MEKWEEGRNVMSWLGKPLHQTICACPAICGLRYQIIKPPKSFFSPLKGIPENTVITLTGDIRLEIRMKQTFSGTLVPHITPYIGVSWGKNMKGTDWVTFTRFHRGAVAHHEPARK